MQRIKRLLYFTGGLVLFCILAYFWYSDSSSLNQIKTEANKDVLGYWKELTVHEENEYDRSLVKIDQNAKGKLRAFYVDLRPSCLLRKNIKEIEYKDEILSYGFPDWGNGRTIFKGRLTQDKNKIEEMTDSDYKKVWMRLRDPDTISSLRSLESAFRTSKKITYRYEVPDRTEDGWLCAALDELEIESDLISDMVIRILKGKYDDIHNIIIIKDGKITLEEYFQENGKFHGPPVTQWYRDRKHLLASATKSITSILVGIAKSEGHITDLEAPVLNFFPEFDYLKNQEKMNIKLKHLITMTAGLEWQQSSKDPGDVLKMWQTDDIARFYLEKPMVQIPGEKYIYTNANSTLLGIIVEKVSGIDVEAFSKKFLFSPLNISNYDWARYPDGSVDSDGGLALCPRDMAKLGQLFLNDGIWKGEQIVSAEWIKDSTGKQVKRTDNLWYGFMWWRRTLNVHEKPVDSFYAFGWGGQYIFVIPEFNMVIVSNALNFSYKPERFLLNIIEDFILPAVM